MHDDADDTQDAEEVPFAPPQPEAALPDEEQPEFEAPDAEQPVSESADAEAPDAEQPDAEVAESELTEAEPSDSDSTVAEVPDSQSADAEVPDSDSDSAVAEATDPVTSATAPSMDDLAARAAAEGTSMMALLLEEGDFLPGRYQRGDVVEGTVVSKSRDQLTVNLGAKQEAVVPPSDVARVPKAVWDAVQPGDTLQLVVMRPDGRDGEVVLSMSQALTGEDWTRAEELLTSGQVEELEIVGFNRGGILVGFGGLQGFIPRSQMARTMPEGGPERMAEFVGQRVVVKVVEVSRAKRRLIMSERQAAREWRSERKRQLLGDLNDGDVRRGRVTSIADFGAFIDVGGADGLVHVSEMSFDRNRRPSEIVKVGDEVDVLVLSIDRERKRISLSMKRLQKDPWAVAAEEHYIGELVDGVVVSLADFGAFVRLPDSIEGLIHVSELSDTPVRSPSEIVRAGQTVTVEIIALDPDRQRLGLSLKRVPEHLRHSDPGPEVDEPVMGGAVDRASDEPVLDTRPVEPLTGETEAPGAVEADEVAPVEADAMAAVEADDVEPAEADAPAAGEADEVEPVEADAPAAGETDDVTRDEEPSEPDAPENER